MVPFAYFCYFAFELWSVKCPFFYHVDLSKNILISAFLSSASERSYYTHSENDMVHRVLTYIWEIL